MDATSRAGKGRRSSLERTVAIPGAGSSSFPDEPNVRDFAGYELVEEINRGGMGIVYKARDRRNGMPRLRIWRRI